MRSQCCTTSPSTSRSGQAVSASSASDHPSSLLTPVRAALSTFGVDAVVLEPLSAMSDSYNNHDGLHILSSGEEYTNVMAISIE